ncbi:MAG: hypothetical protein H7235_10025 [Bdellovibrionaceae bacterium]|nr:hypothetical protein [Pseudobdellovibrionaceae bacterium]
MRRLNIVSLIILWSSSMAIAAGVSVKSSFAFKPLLDLTVESSKIEISNMPKIRSQGEFPICYGIAAATLAQWYVCKEKNIADCKQVPPESEISPFSMVGWARKNIVICEKKDGKLFDEIGSEVPAEYCGTEKLGGAIASSYSNLGLFEGASSAAMMNSARAFSFKTEACFKNDEVINRYGKTKDSVEDFLNKVKSLYANNKGKTEGCESCLTGIAEEANKLLSTNQINVSLIKEALDKNTVQEFLYKIVFRDCPSISVSRRPNVKLYPDTYVLAGEKDAASVNDIAEKVKTVLTQGKPVLLNDICLLRDANNNCTEEHVVVISGYKEACDKSGKSCKKLLKVQNSWGADWQKLNNDGWVDEATLMANISHQSPFKRGVLSWYE